MYSIRVDWAPAYELLASLEAFVARSERKTLDIGAEWVKSVRLQLTPAFASRLSAGDWLDCADLIDLLIWKCPAERDCSGFLGWLEGLTAAELYELLASDVKTTRHLPRDLAGMRDDLVGLLDDWYVQYFRDVDPVTLSGLEADAQAKRALVGTTPAPDLVELATSGACFAPDTSPPLLLLVPQYHFRPWNLFATYRDMELIRYPADVLAPAPGDPPPRALRLARALSDESRLRILRFLAAEPRSFMHVARFAGLSKSTVHHHMMTLRAAGLVRACRTGDNDWTYSVRLSALDELGNRLRAYLAEGSEGGSRDGPG